MTAKKYWKHVIQGPFYQNLEPGMTGTSIWAHHNEYGNGCTLGYHCINAPYGEPKAHSHNFHELICFIGGNPENINDLGAEIHIRLGEELEEHVFTTATMLSLPPGLQHGYLEVKNITRPFILLEISSTTEYGQPAETTAENE
ncbi:MAG: hypothetical protein GX631_03840 [Dehalococcoidales bacterium]|nr:hypothetical protein [Dehalococcoidales bacterium]